MKIKKYKNKFIIIMYHHIVKNRKYLNGINSIKFEQQIKYFKRNYNVLNPIEFYRKLEKNDFNKKDCVLTFDDGYQSHFKYAYKILNKYHLKGFFYPIILGFNSNKIHHLNKIQILLKVNKNKKKIFKQIIYFIKKKNKTIYKNLEKIIKKIETKPFYDNSTDIIIKRLLQRDLPLPLRKKICNHLFDKINIKKNLLKKFYMTDAQLKKLKDDGHEIGVHTMNHFWMSTLTKKQQRQEIKSSLNLLRKKKLINNKWSFCHPFGDYNKSTIEVLKKLNCTAAFALKNKSMITKNIKKFELSRLDCNEFL